MNLFMQLPYLRKILHRYVLYNHSTTLHRSTQVPRFAVACTIVTLAIRTTPLDA
jgi:hypothetical protein